jgi:predicted DNA-binding antitoxin AbrB/MazE fold protein
MFKTVWAEVRSGKIELLESVDLPEGSKVLVTVLEEENERQFGERISETSLSQVWNNPDDDIYGELLEK